MPDQPNDFMFAIHDLARSLRLYADQKASQLGISRAQWGALIKVERHPGLKQSELADMLDIQPITLTRLIDRLCDNDLIERRNDATDRRAKRLYLTPAALPIMRHLHTLREEINAAALANIDANAIAKLVGQMHAVKDNVRAAIAAEAESAKAKHHG